MNSQKVPALAEKLLHLFLREDLKEEVCGDLDEEFYHNYTRLGSFRARLIYWYQVLNYLRPFAFKKRQRLHNINMIGSYFRLGWRNLLRSKTYSLINISGFSIGLACAIAIGLFIADELSYDRFHVNASNIYRVIQHQNRAGQTYDMASTPGPLGASLKADFPEIEAYCLVGDAGPATVRHNNVIASSNSVKIADNNFFRVLTFPLVLGDPKHVLTEPNHVVISEQMAGNIFGPSWRSNQNVIGSTLFYQKDTELMIVGVAKDAPPNSSIQFDMVLAYEEPGSSPWGSNDFHTYIQLPGRTEIPLFETRLHDYLKKFVDMTYYPDGLPQFSLQPLLDIYLHSDFAFRSDWDRQSDIAYVRIFGTVGAVVLVIAIFNFINLATARAIRRAKEVGIRKTIGAIHRQLVVQFLCESIMMTVVSVAIAIALVLIALPFLNGLSQKQLSVPFFEPAFIPLLFLFIVIVGVLAGLYPSFYLASFRPAKVLKGALDVRSGRSFRHILVVAQFSLTIVLVSGSLVIFEQLKYIQQKNPGFDKEQLIYLNAESLSQADVKRLRLELVSKPAISHVALTSGNLINFGSATFAFNWEGQQEGEKFLMTCMNIDPDYFPAAGMQIIAGRNFSNKSLADTSGFVINQSAARRMGWKPEDAIGKKFRIWDNEGFIIGVVGDFHFEAMSVQIAPFTFRYRPTKAYRGILMRARTGASEEAIASAVDVYKKFESEVPASYSFVDQDLDNQYRYEQRTGKLVFTFSFLSIFVACLGLYGLATFSAERRTKEIGIRKILGASVTQISGLLSKDFIFLILVSIAIAAPIGYFMMREWLSSFVYRIELSWNMFVVAAMLPLAIAFLTVVYQALSAAMMNTVDSLRSE